MHRRNAFPAIVEIGSGVMSRLPEILRTTDLDARDVVVVTGVLSSRGYAEDVVRLLRARGSRVRLVSVRRGTVGEASRLSETLRCDDIVLAVGGGKVVDVAKLAARYAGAYLVSVPTTLAHDGISSPIASLTDEQGRKSSLAAVMPLGVVVDTDVAGTAPIASLRAGLGDLLSNLTAVLDWRLATASGKETYDEVAGSIAEHSAFAVFHMAGVPGNETVAQMSRSLVMSGLAMAASDSSRPCSGAEHLISHSLDDLLGPRAQMHGLQVALGTLIAAAAHGRYLPELRRVYRTLGLPLHPGQLGISMTELAESVIRAPAMRPNRYTVLDEVDLTRRGVHRLLAAAFADTGDLPVSLIPQPRSEGIEIGPLRVLPTQLG